MPELDRDAPLYVAGHRGLVGSAVQRTLEANGFRNLITATSRELDLRDRDRTFEFIERTRPRTVVLAAAKVGGIMANANAPADFFSDNIQIQVNVIDAAVARGVEKLLFLGSSCIYPKFAEQPISEDSLLTGVLEPTNDAYAIAKIAGVLQIQAVRRQHGLSYISAMPTNLYGPNDNYSSNGSHVLPSLIRRYHEAVQSGADEVVNWGTGTPRREFLHVDDLGAACLFLLENYDDPEPINVGTGRDLPISELADMVAAAVGFTGRTTWDSEKPDGTPRKQLDVSRLTKLGWQATIDLRDGLVATYQDFLAGHGRNTSE